ncbi:Rhodopirellula transposase family protein [mine drainage metagenome]|uniref:Rhodopirellula transposase family protein n=1 Tax=mine drainage metagenome TaxID=410659 RepID=T1AFB8_9ZZZZ
MALEAGWGGVRRVQKLTGFSINTVRRGVREVRAGLPSGLRERVRALGAGRKPVEKADPAALRALTTLVEAATAGKPDTPLLWTHKSTRTLASQMTREGHPMSHSTVARLLKGLGYSLQVNAKRKESRSPAERDSQFHYLNDEVKVFQTEGNPVLSVDTKKKEKVGLFKNAGLRWLPKGEPVEVNTYDFPQLGKGTAIPYGAYDVGRNEGFVSVGMNHDTAEFAVESLRWWWRKYGRKRYPEATRLLICADGGGSNASRNRGWKRHLQELATETGLPITVGHYPPGASKWNKIEHRMFSQISLNWQGVPLETYETVVNLIAGTRTRTGLQVKARLDRGVYAKGEKVPDKVMAGIRLKRHAINPKWNYTIEPVRRQQTQLTAGTTVSS